MCSHFSSFFVHYSITIDSSSGLVSQRTNRTAISIRLSTQNDSSRFVAAPIHGLLSSILTQHRNIQYSSSTTSERDKSSCTTIMISMHTSTTTYTQWPVRIGLDVPVANSLISSMDNNKYSLS